MEAVTAAVQVQCGAGCPADIGPAGSHLYLPATGS